MPGPHAYFAYGSNLCASQMARRCPGACEPRPGVLADHDWLINERGVATVEPFPGSTVHGVLWTLTDSDIATLDAAEGVPHRYRRARLTVHTSSGAGPAWVYVDHRVRAGRPHPGYLDRVVDGARHHGLPQRWVDFLRRWDPGHWPTPRPRPEGLGPRTLSELLADPSVRESATLRSRFGFMAIHGGGLEQMTDVIAERAAARSGASVYTVIHPPDYPHHLSSSRYLPGDSGQLDAFLDHVDVVVSLHGYGRAGRSTHLLAGGRNRALAAHLAARVEIPGYRVVTDLDDIPAELRGLHADNPVNRPRDDGAQVELPARVRGTSPRSQPPGSGGLSPATAALVAGLADAAMSWPGRRAARG
jgi:phage replication-related protein YjqB (UPF0714/DUF867 family)